MRPRLPALLAAWCGLAAPSDGQIDVRVLPGFPNAPHLSPAERVPVRPDTPFLVWGNVAGGLGAGIGMDYAWTFTHGPDLTVQHDGELLGTITDDRFVFEEVRFQLAPNATRAFVEATLTVRDALGNQGSRLVALVVISTRDPLSDTPLEALAIDVNIAIRAGLRWLYLQQNADPTSREFGSWSSPLPIRGANQPCAGTAFALWAFQNQGHLATNDPREDIYAETVMRANAWLLRTAQVLPVVGTPNAPGQRSDLNANQRVVTFCGNSPFQEPAGYASPIAASAIVASSSPTTVVRDPRSALDGLTHREILEDWIDWSGQVQNTSNGGWTYAPANTESRSDMSINGWHTIAMEGAQKVFGIDVPDWIIRASEHSLVSHQTMPSTGWGYTGAGPCNPSGTTMATTGGGLSGLALVELETPPIGQVIRSSPPPLDSIPARRAAGLFHLGARWGDGVPGPYCQGHRGNTYAMWTVARALRMTADALNLPPGDKVVLTNGNVDFDWETGEENRSGRIAPPNGPREGYFPWLVRNQQRGGAPEARGRWDDPVFVGSTFATSLAVLVLTPRVFLDFRTPPEIAIVEETGAILPCPATLVGTTGHPLRFEVFGTDLDPGQNVTLEVVGLPRGAVHEPALPRTETGRVRTRFLWEDPVPGRWEITYTVRDETGLVDRCTLRLAIQGATEFFLPVRCRVRTIDGRQRVQIAGFVDAGRAEPSLDTAILTLEGAAHVMTGLTSNARGTRFRYQDPELRFTASFSPRGSSKGKFTSRWDVPGTPVSFLQVISMGLAMPEAEPEARVILNERGRYRLGRRAGALLSPPFFPASIQARIGGRRGDRARIRLGFAGPDTPRTTPAITVGFGDFRQTIPPWRLTRDGDVYEFVDAAANGIRFLRIDFVRKTVDVRMEGVAFGPFPGANPRAVLGFGWSEDPRSVPVDEHAVVLGRRGSSLRY